MEDGNTIEVTHTHTRVANAIKAAAMVTIS